MLIIWTGVQSDISFPYEAFLQASKLAIYEQCFDSEAACPVYIVNLDDGVEKSLLFGIWDELDGSKLDVPRLGNYIMDPIDEAS